MGARNVLLLAGGAVAGAIAYRRRRSAGRRERVDLYFADGSMISLAGDADEAQRLLPLGRDILRTASAR